MTETAKPCLRSTIDRQLPFELRALESALAAAVRTLEIETMILEKQTLSALSRLMVKVGRLSKQSPLLLTHHKGISTTTAGAADVMRMPDLLNTRTVRHSGLKFGLGATQANCSCNGILKTAALRR